MESYLLMREWCFSSGWGSLILPQLSTCTDSFWSSGLIFNPQLCPKSHFFGVYLESLSFQWQLCPHVHATLDLSPDVLHKGWVLRNHAVRLFTWPVPWCYPWLPLLSKGPFGMVEHDPKQTHLWSLCRNPHPLAGVTVTIEQHSLQRLLSLFWLLVQGVIQHIQTKM